MHPDSVEFNELISAFPPKKKAFLRLIASGSSVDRAESTLKMTANLSYKWAKSDPAFKAALAEAKEASVDGLETVLMRCARMTQDDPRYQQSLMFLLKSRRRSVYGDKVEQTVVQEQPTIRIELTDHAQETNHDEDQDNQTGQKALQEGQTPVCDGGQNDSAADQG